MENNDLQKISLRIFERGKFSLEIPSKDEGIFRKASELISKKTQQYRAKHLLVDSDDILGMAVLHCVVEILQEYKRKDVQPLLNELNAISDDLLAFVENSDS